MLIFGSCLSLALSFSGCCILSLSSSCSNNGCYCHQYCHILNNCCSDIADIGCYPTSSSSTVSLTITDTLGKTKSEAHLYISQWVSFNIKQYIIWYNSLFHV